MITLKTTDFNVIQHWFIDYQKRSRNYEVPPDNSEILGIYDNGELIGYFIVRAFTSGIVEINQGYLKPDARHKKNNYIAMKLLEDLARSKGLKRIVLGTNRAVGSYQKFMRNLGFQLTRAEFCKEIV